MAKQSLTVLSDKITELHKKLAAAKSEHLVLEYDRKIVQSKIQNKIELEYTSTDKKPPTEARLDRLSRDTQAYCDTILALSRSEKVVGEAEADLEAAKREWQIALMEE